MTKLAVATGGNFLKSLEVVNLDGSIPDITCDNLQDYPLGITGAIGHLYQEKIPLICGGFSNNVILCNCFQFENGAWNAKAGLIQCVRSAVAFSLNYESNQTLLVTGGLNSQSLSFVQSYHGQVWNQESQYELPRKMYYHCMVKISNSVIFLISGYTQTLSNLAQTTSGETFFHFPERNTWTPGPMLINPRYFHSCGLLYQQDPATQQLQKIVVVAAGKDNNATPLKSVELLYLDKYESGWMAGPSLPETAIASSMVEFQNSVILVGGDGSVDGQHLYQLSSTSGPWVKMKQTLKEPRAKHVSFLIPDRLANCH